MEASRRALPAAAALLAGAATSVAEARVQVLGSSPARAATTAHTASARASRSASAPCTLKEKYSPGSGCTVASAPSMLLPVTGAGEAAAGLGVGCWWGLGEAVMSLPGDAVLSGQDQRVARRS